MPAGSPSTASQIAVAPEPSALLKASSCAASGAMPFSCSQPVRPAVTSRPSTVPWTPPPGAERKSTTAGSAPASCRAADSVSAFRRKCGCGHGAGDRVLRGVLHRSGQPQDLRRGDGSERRGAVDGEVAGGHGAGLVQQDGVNGPGVLEDLRALDQDAQLRAPAGSGEQPHRGGQAQGAGAGDDQHGDGGREGGTKFGVADGRSGRQQPGAEGQRGDGQDHGDEHRADPVREAGNGRLAGLRLGDQPAHLRQGRFSADARGPHQQPAGSVDGGARDRAVRADFHRHGFAGDQRGVDGGRPFDDDAVGRDFLAGADHNDVAHRQLIGRHLLLPAVPEDRGILGAQVQQGLEGVSGLLFGVGLQVPAQQQEGGDHRGNLEVEPAGAHALHTRVVSHPRVHQELPRREDVGRGHADGDERVHRGGEVPGVDGGGPVERPRRPGDHGQGQKSCHPAPVGELEGREHRNQEHRDRQDCGDDEARAELGCGGRRRVGAVWSPAATPPATCSACSLVPRLDARFRMPRGAARGCVTGAATSYACSGLPPAAPLWPPSSSISTGALTVSGSMGRLGTWGCGLWLCSRLPPPWR